MAYRLVKHLISLGRTYSMADKLGALMLGGSISYEQYTKLVGLLTLYHVLGGGSCYIDCPTGKTDAIYKRKTANMTYILVWEKAKGKGDSTMEKGIDVSEHQGVINWDTVKPKIDFAIIRAGYGRNNIDDQFVRNISECNRLGIPCGVYWFSYALTADDARQEARYCIEAVKGYIVELPVCFDFEYDSVTYAGNQGVTVTKTLAIAMLKAFCEEIERSGYFAMMYTNGDYLSRYYEEELTQRFALWFATYPVGAVDLDQPPRECVIWQYSSSGSVDGINVNVDMNVAYTDYAARIKELGLNHLPVADEVEEAIKKLRAAGYDEVLIKLAALIK